MLNVNPTIKDLNSRKFDGVFHFCWQCIVSSCNNGSVQYSVVNTTATLGYHLACMPFMYYFMYDPSCTTLHVLCSHLEILAYKSLPLAFGAIPWVVETYVHSEPCFLVAPP